MNILIDILKNGYAYDVQTTEGTSERVMVPPSRYSIQAASELVRMHNVLERLNVALEQERAINLQLHAECEQYRRTINDLTRASNSTPVPS